MICALWGALVAVGQSGGFWGKVGDGGAFVCGGGAQIGGPFKIDSGGLVPVR